jgi:choline kinase
MLGLINAVNDNVLIVYGDLVFNGDAVDNLPSEHSVIVVDTKEQFSKEEVGVVLDNEAASYFSYGMAMKWAQILFLNGKELEMFKTLAIHKDRHKMFPFEAMNEVIEKLGNIPIIEHPKAKIVEIDTIKNIPEAISIC